MADTASPIFAGSALLPAGLKMCLADSGSSAAGPEMPAAGSGKVLAGSESSGSWNRNYLSWEFLHVSFLIGYAVAVQRCVDCLENDGDKVYTGIDTGEHCETGG